MSNDLLSDCPIPQSNLPEDGLRYFHGLSNWIETAKDKKPHLVPWKKGYKALSLIDVVKYKEELPHQISKGGSSQSTLYVPIYSSGLFVLRHLRNAFCHNALYFDDLTKQYHIITNSEVKIFGQFSLEAIIDFTNAFFNIDAKSPINNQHNNQIR